MTRRRELLRFLIAGSSAVAVDGGTYAVLLRYFSHWPSKMTSFILGSIVAFLLNKYWTFEKPEPSGPEVIRFAVLYTTTLLANTLVNSGALWLTNQVFLSFLLATGTSTVLNFLGQKFWVFGGRLEHR